jgi:plastocyanin
MSHRRHALPLAALLAGVALVASACSLTDQPGPEREDRATPPTSAHRAARKPGPTWATGDPVRVVMNDRFRYRPSAIMVRAGRRVTFAVTNAGQLPHEFILGDRATQLDHERQMQQAAPPPASTPTSTPTAPPTRPTRAPPAPSPSPQAGPGA